MSGEDAPRGDSADEAPHRRLAGSRRRAKGAEPRRLRHRRALTFGAPRFATKRSTAADVIRKFRIQILCAIYHQTWIQRILRRFISAVRHVACMCVYVHRLVRVCVCAAARGEVDAARRRSGRCAPRALRSFLRFKVISGVALTHRSVNVCRTNKSKRSPVKVEMRAFSRHLVTPSTLGEGEGTGGRGALGDDDAAEGGGRGDGRRDSTRLESRVRATITSLPLVLRITIRHLFSIIEYCHLCVYVCFLASRSIFFYFTKCTTCEFYTFTIL